MFIYIQVDENAMHSSNCKELVLLQEVFHLKT